MNSENGTDSFPGRLPLHGLMIFEAVARNGSISEAARALKLTQPAVSHALKKLEKTLQTNLVERGRSGIKLTDSGQQLFMACSKSFELLIDTIDAIRPRTETRQKVTLSVSTATATYWLLPRMAEFYHLHPHIEVHLVTRDSDENLSRAGYDLAIPLAVQPENPAEYHQWKLLDEVVYPVASPYLLQQVGVESATVTIEQLADFPFLHLETSHEARVNWDAWLKEVSRQSHQQYLTPEAQRHHYFSDYFIAVSAAISGQGVALGWHHIIKDLLADGRLVRLGRAKWRSPHPFILQAPRRQPLSPAAIDLKNWLLALS
ncbi:MAG: LysR substrate-binding domain-containing protein [Amphritea sp.]|nr:LysR substrate-binding domain-containing protein [Amphritea sp.]